VPEWRTGYGANNWAAFTDGLTDYLLTGARPHRALVLRGFDAYRRHDPDTMAILIDQLARLGRWHLLFGRRLICLVLTDDVNLELGPVGGEHVGWNRHEWLLVHRNGSRIPPWITADKPTDATIKDSLRGSAHTLPPDDLLGRAG
jgi:Barstar (barnase inhibitor)